MWRKAFIALSLIYLLKQQSEALNNGLALTPPMGWMSWQRYRCEIDCDTYPDECIRYGLFFSIYNVPNGKDGSNKQNSSVFEYKTSIIKWSRP